MKTVSVIIPAMNEAEGIGCTLEALPIEQLSKSGYSTEVLVVDGCSMDNTLDIARSKGAKIIVERRRGYGRAYKTGFQSAAGDFIVTMDADGSYPAQQVPQLLDYLVKNDLDLVTTCRLSYMQPGAMSVSHRFGNEILNLLSRIFFRLNLRDTQSGMWVFKRSLLGIVGVRSDGMAFSQEFKIRSFQKPLVCHARIIEIEISDRRRYERNSPLGAPQCPSDYVLLYTSNLNTLHPRSRLPSFPSRV